MTFDLRYHKTQRSPNGGISAELEVVSNNNGMEVRRAVIYVAITPDGDSFSFSPWIEHVVPEAISTRFPLDVSTFSEADE